MSVIVKGLSKQFDHQLAVNQLSFEAHPGQILGLVGINGIGKSTALMILGIKLKPNLGNFR